MIPSFEERYRTAIADGELRRTLLEFQRNWRRSRDGAIDPEAFADARTRLSDIKQKVIARLPEYVAQFEAAAAGSGAVTYRAADASDAVRYVVSLAQARAITVAVKSKSMLSEEIGLNHGLEAAGILPVETDLGEWIVQLAGERPSHIVGPALHKNRRQVAALLRAATGMEVSDEDIQQQVGVARTAMRSHFLAATMGISGGNALVAETGTVIIATNEGNAELVTSVPPIHVAVVGIEKLVPSLDDALLQLQLLAPSATGQSGTNYVTLITGPCAPDRELHIVLVDNGRSRMRLEPDFREALGCIRCGACSSVCPSYGAVGGHVFGYIYSGAIGLINTPFHHGLENAAGPQSLCVSCGACTAVCPVEIPLARQILDVRARVAEAGLASLHARAVAELWSRPIPFRLAARVAGIAQLPGQHGSFLLSPVSRKTERWRDLPAISRTPFRSRKPLLVPASGAPLSDTLGGMNVTFFVQCLTDWLHPEIAGAIVNVLRRLGAFVTVPRTQHCCGLSALDAGFTEPAKRMARHTISVLEQTHADFIVTGGTSCAIAIAYDYPHLFRDDPEWKERAIALGSRVVDFTTFMHSVARLPAGSLAQQPGGTATYHYFCQSYNILKFRDEPVRLLGDTCGLQFVPLFEANVCCGFGGSVSLERPEMSRQILERKLANVEESGAPLLVTDNPGCIMHMRGGLSARDSSVRVRHTAEIVSACLERLQTIGGRGR